jgi:hypothetical protein
VVVLALIFSFQVLSPDQSMQSGEKLFVLPVNKFACTTCTMFKYLLKLSCHLKFYKEGFVII